MLLIPTIVTLVVIQRERRLEIPFRLVLVVLTLFAPIIGPILALVYLLATYGIAPRMPRT